MRAARFTIFALGMFVLAGSRADPVIESVEPRQVFVDEAAELTISGGGIETDAWTAVLDGGPFVAGTLDFPGETTGALTRVDDRHVAVATNRALYVVDVSDPTAPTPVGSRSTPSRPVSATSDGNLVVIGDRSGEIRVFDVRDRAEPTPLATLSSRPEPKGLVLLDDVLFVGTGREFRFWCLEGGFDSFSLADPGNPVPLASMTMDGCVRSATTDGAVVHLLTQSNDAPRMNLIVLDVTDPSAPAEVSRLAWPNPDAYDASALAFDGGTGYVVQEYPPSVRTVDLRDPAAPREIHLAPAPIQLFRTVAASAGRLLVGSADGVQWYDVRDPGSTVFLAEEQAATFGGLVADGDVAYAIGYLHGDPFTVLDGSVAVRPAAPVPHPGVPGGFEYVFDGVTAFAADSYVGVHVLDATDPDSPAYVDTVTGPRSVRGIAAESGVLYVSDSWYDEILAYDVSDPRAVGLLGSLGTGTVRDITAVSRFVYATDDRRRGIRVLDFRDPSSPGEASFLSLQGVRPRGIARADDGSSVYVVGEIDFGPVPLGTLHVLDSTAPGAPRVAGVTFWAGRPRQLAVDGRDVWIADEVAGVLRVDVSAPERPTYRVALEIENALGVARLDRWLAVSRGSLGNIRTEVRVYDVEDPEDPRLHQQHALEPTVFRLHASEQVLWFDRDELTTLAIPPPPSALRPVGPDAWATVLPPGRPAGPYDVRVRNADGAADRARNALRVCERRYVAARLTPSIPPAGRWIVPVRWRLAVEGDGIDLVGGHVLVPAVDPAVEPAFVSTEEPDTIELLAAGGEVITSVLLRGSDEARLRSRWREIRTQGRASWPRNPAGGPGEVLLDARTAPDTRVRYVLRADGSLDAAFAFAPAPDLAVEANAVDDRGCRYEAATTLAEEIAALCEEAGPTVRCIGSARP